MLAQFYCIIETIVKTAAENSMELSNLSRFILLFLLFFLASLLGGLVDIIVIVTSVVEWEFWTFLSEILKSCAFRSAQESGALEEHISADAMAGNHVACLNGGAAWSLSAVCGLFSGDVGDNSWSCEI